MVRICDYSSLIFAGNTTVLLILSLSTDYWEYRTFDNGKILQAVAVSNWTKLVLPLDTKSYIQIQMSSPLGNTNPRDSYQDETFYHPPLFVKRVYVESDFKTPAPRDAGPGRKAYNSSSRWMMYSEVNLFLQYGNLFRDCDALEAEVRVRLGFNQKRKTKCVFFDSARESSAAYTHAPELSHLETAACVCALLCMAAIVTGSTSGGYALLSSPRCFRAYKLASCMSLSAGFFLTIGIALFHGKCHILRKMEILPGQELPFKKTLNDSRTYTYGWSFSLAWVCVFFCYTSAFVWLFKSQGSLKGRVYLMGRSKAPRRRTSQGWVRKRGYSQYRDRAEDIATV